MSGEIDNYLTTLELTHSSFKSFSTLTITNSLLDPSFKQDLIEAIAQIRRLPYMWLSFSPVIPIITIVCLVAMISVTYFFPYIIIAFWVLVLGLFYFMDFQFKNRARLTFKVSEVLERFMSKTGDLFRINVKLSFGKKRCLPFRTSVLEITIRCHRMTIVEEGADPMIVTCGKSVMQKSNTLEIKQAKRNKVFNVYTLNKAQIVPYNEKTSMNPAIIEKINRDSIRSYKKSLNLAKDTDMLSQISLVLTNKNERTYSNTGFKTKRKSSSHLASPEKDGLDKVGHLNFANNMMNDLSQVLDKKEKDSEELGLRNKSLMGREPLRALSTIDNRQARS